MAIRRTRQPTTRAVVLAAILPAAILASVLHADMFLQGIGGDHAMSRTNDRFYSGADRAFMGEAYDWSGVGRSSNGAWVTMISPTHFVSANHYHPNAGDTITFFEGNSALGPSHAYTVAAFGYDTTYGGQSSDLWLGRLTAPLSPKHRIATYPVLALGGDAAYLDSFILAYGAPNRVGTSRLGAIVDDFEIGRTRTMRFWFHAAEGTGTGASDCHLIGGDSGGPSFALVGGRLALVGVHFTTNDTNGVPDPEDSWPFGYGWSGDSFVPFYIDQLDANMGAERVRVVRSRADFTLDGRVDSGDLAVLLSSWGETTGAHDLDGDGVVSSPDLAALLSAWG
ncbi:MAG: dockerin type I domain-containing protein [Planctomycetota bacterium]